MEDNRQARLDAQVKKSIDARTKEFKEKLAKLTYEKIKQTLVPSPVPLKGYPHNESIEEEVTISLDESVLAEKLRLRSPNKTTKIDIDYIGSSSDINKPQRQHNIKIKKTGSQTADITGKKADIVAFLQGDAYMMDDGDLKDIFPELLENINNVIKHFPRDREWKQIITKHRRAIEKYQRGGDLDQKAEDDIIGWAMDNGEIKTDDADETDEFMMKYVEESTNLSELNARYDLSDMKQSKDPKVKRELSKLNKVKYGSMQYIRQYKEVEAALDASLPANKRKK